MSQYPPPPTANSHADSPYAQLQAAAANAPFFEPVHQDLNFNHQPAYPGTDSSPEQIQPSTAAGNNGVAPKINRLRKACDSCSIRKVKCDEAGPPCRACATLDIPCTFERPSRRRGPPNRHAEAMKRRKLGSPGLSGPSSPASPTHAAQALASLSAQPLFSTEPICPLDMLELLINDFFTYIHPLCPFPHEDSFREAFARREDLSNPRFLALLASMIAVLVASFPRKPRLRLKAHGLEQRFPNSISLVQHCQKVAVAARGVGYLESEDLNVHDAIVSYFLGLTGVYTYRWRLSRLYWGEAITIASTLGLYKADAASGLGGANNVLESDEQGQQVQSGNSTDYVTREIGRRLVWTLFVGVRTMQQLGASFSEFRLPPPKRSDPYPPLPVEVDDRFIHSTFIEQQTPDVVSILTGFNANVRIYQSYQALSTAEWAYGIDEVFDFRRKKKLLDQCLQNSKHALDGVPSELMVWSGFDHLGQQGRSYFPNQPDYRVGRDTLSQDLDGIEDRPYERRRRQYEIQKANIHATYLATRLYIVEKYWTLCEAHNRRKVQELQEQRTGSSPRVISAGLDEDISASRSSPDMTEQDFYDERECLVKDLLVVLSSISRESMEPMANSFVSRWMSGGSAETNDPAKTMKIRQIASTLLEVPQSRKGQVGLKAEEYLETFLDLLMQLERTGSAWQTSESPDEEEADLRHWADLRDCQMKFAQAGGVLGAT